MPPVPQLPSYSKEVPDWIWSATGMNSNLAISGQVQTSKQTAAKHSAMGRAKNAPKSPFDLIMEVMKFSSSMPPKTTPKMAGAMGNLLASKI